MLEGRRQTIAPPSARRVRVQWLGGLQGSAPHSFTRPSGVWPVKMARVAAVLGITAAVQAPARAERGPFTGAELYSLCNSQVAVIKADCVAYLGGFVEGVIVGQQLTTFHILLCLPAGVSMLQLRLIVQKGMRDHPENLDQTANAVVATALIDAFKCRPGQVPVYGHQ